MLEQVEANVQTFNSANFGELRTQLAQDGRVWFCLNDVANALELVNPRKVVERLAKRGVTTSDTPTAGGTQSMTYIDEPNLYRCIFQSRKKEAEKFQDWVFEEVLPSIRQNGGYIATQEADTPEMIMARALKVAEQTIINHQQRLQQVEAERDTLQSEVKVLTPKAEYTDKVLNATGTLTTNVIAQELGMSAIKLNSELKKRGVQYKQGRQWLLTAKYRDKGLISVRTHIATNPNTGEQKTYSNTVWTERGRQFIHTLFSTNN